MCARTQACIPFGNHLPCCANIDWNNIPRNSAHRNNAHKNNAEGYFDRQGRSYFVRSDGDEMLIPQLSKRKLWRRMLLPVGEFMRTKTVHCCGKPHPKKEWNNRYARRYSIFWNRHHRHWIFRFTSGDTGGKERTIDVRSDLQREYMPKMKDAMKSTAWQNGSCKSFYRKGKTSEVTTLSPESMVNFIFLRI